MVSAGTDVWPTARATLMIRNANFTSVGPAGRPGRSAARRYHAPETFRSPGTGPRHEIKMTAYRFCWPAWFDCHRPDQARNPRCAVSFADEIPRAHRRKENCLPESESKNTVPCQRRDYHANKYRFPKARQIRGRTRDARRNKKSSPDIPG